MTESTITSVLNKALVVVEGLLVLFIGPLDIQLRCVLLLSIMDLILGVMASKKNKTFNKEYFLARTIEKNVVYLIWIIIGHTADLMIKLPDTIRGVVLFIMFTREIVSASKNTSELGYKDLSEQIVKKISPLVTKEDKGGSSSNEDK